MKRSNPYSLNAYHERQRAKREAAKVEGVVTIGQKQGRIHVCAPYSDDFRAFAYGVACGKWRERSGVWSFDVQVFEAVYNKLCEIYGKGAIKLQDELFVPAGKCPRCGHWSGRRYPGTEYCPTCQAAYIAFIS